MKNKLLLTSALISGLSVIGSAALDGMHHRAYLQAQKSSVGGVAGK